jgi:Dynamin family
VDSSLLAHIQTATKLLEIDSNSSLAKDIATVTDRVYRFSCREATPTSYQIAVFGPFNHGKSTLLNAILGSKILPIDLIPTTGAAIRVVYGAEITTTITLTSGEVIHAATTDILTQFAILDDDRRMRDDVVSIEVSCPHPFLEMGVELIDLPGTNDRDEQDTFVRERLLSADLVVNVLDVRKLMTLGEREHLRDWLENRGINTVVFVANFTNLLEPEEQKQVQQRLRFVAESFRSDLPAGISNLYRVDALPALRARLKGDDATLHTSGLSTFISALQAIATHQKSELDRVRQPQLQAISSQLRGLLSAQLAQLELEINTRSTKAARELSLKRQAQQLIQTGWENSLKELEQWLYLPNLISCFQTELATATEQGIFPQWEATNIAPKLEHFQREINDWVVKATEFFNVPEIEPLTLTAPEPPEVLLPSNNPKSTTDALTPTALVTGLGWLMGGPVGAVVAGGASILADKLDRDRSVTKPNHAAEIMDAYIDASEDYLLQLNTINIAKIKDYRSRAVGVINVEINSDLEIDPIQQQKLVHLSATLDRLSNL